jgi:hypothetical protein
VYVYAVYLPYVFRTPGDKGDGEKTQGRETRHEGASASSSAGSRTGARSVKVWRPGTARQPKAAPGSASITARSTAGAISRLAPQVT